MNVVSERTLALENARFRGTAGVSENRPLGFRPAFMDSETRSVYPSRFADGQLAPCHVLDGLPGHLVLSRDGGGREVKSTVVSGFVREGVFYTRDEAAAAATGPARRNGERGVDFGPVRRALSGALLRASIGGLGASLLAIAIVLVLA